MQDSFIFLTTAGCTEASQAVLYNEDFDLVLMLTLGSEGL